VKSAGRKREEDAKTEVVVTVVGWVGVANRRSTVLGRIAVGTAAFGLPALIVRIANVGGLLLVSFGGVCGCWRGRDVRSNW
jgi:hypothetical protein